MLDPVESHALTREAHMLGAFVGDDFHVAQVKEIRELVKQPKVKRCRKRHWKQNPTSVSAQNERKGFKKLEAKSEEATG